ncbi:unnamed protein product, partial [marine sediment metagenome]
INISIEEICSRTAGSAEKVIKAPVNWSIWNRACVINAFNGLEAVLVDGLSFLVHKGKADMPFTYAGSGVTIVAKHTRQGESIFLDQAGTAGTGEYAFHSGAKRHAASQ